MNKLTIAQWNYGANITDYNQEVMVRLSLLHIACFVIFRVYLLSADFFFKIKLFKNIFLVSNGFDRFIQFHKECKGYQLY